MFFTWGLADDHELYARKYGKTCKTYSIQSFCPIQSIIQQILNSNITNLQYQIFFEWKGITISINGTTSFQSFKSVWFKQYMKKMKKL